MRKTKPLSALRTSEKGSAFFYILLGVILFGTLAFTVSRGMRGQQTSVMSAQQLNVAVSEILNKAKNIEDGINRLRRKNVSESDICFTHNQISATNNAAYALIPTCADDTYRLYHEDGGNVVFQPIPEDWLEAGKSNSAGYGEWIFTNQNSVIGIGAGALNLTSSLELIAHINYLKPEICEALNEKLGISGIPPNGIAFELIAPVNSGFTTASGQINKVAFTEKFSACFGNVEPRVYVFYHVLIQR